MLGLLEDEQDNTIQQICRCLVATRRGHKIEYRYLAEEA